MKRLRKAKSPNRGLRKRRTATDEVEARLAPTMPRRQSRLISLLRTIVTRFRTSWCVYVRNAWTFLTTSVSLVAFVGWFSGGFPWPVAPIFQPMTPYTEPPFQQMFDVINKSGLFSLMTFNVSCIMEDVYAQTNGMRVHFHDISMMGIPTTGGVETYFLPKRHILLVLILATRLL